jgi:hypothetical protein
VNVPLNLPPANLKIKDTQIWDRLRKKYVPLTPEEWVRQHLIAYLVDHLGYPEGRMASEYVVNYNGMKKRCDIVCFDAQLSPFLVVECKAPAVVVTEDTFYQAARYFASLKTSMLVLTNGLQHYCACMDAQLKELRYLPEIPACKDIMG